MAEDPVAPPSGAANVSRRTLLGGIASSPLAKAVRIVPSSSAWERALKAYSAAHRRYEAFLATSLQPAYARLNAHLARAAISDFANEGPVNVSELRRQIAEAERKIVESGGGRTEIRVARATDPEHAALRSTVARELRLRRIRGRLMRQHDVFRLEEQGNDLRSFQMDALQELLVIPAADCAGLLLKVRLSYQEIFRHEDYEGLLGAIFADVERLCG